MLDNNGSSLSITPFLLLSNHAIPDMLYFFISCVSGLSGVLGSSGFSGVLGFSVSMHFTILVISLDFCSYSADNIVATFVILIFLFSLLLTSLTVPLILIISV